MFKIRPVYLHASFIIKKALNFILFMILIRSENKIYYHKKSTIF